MANPTRRVIMDEVDTRTTKERYAVLEAELEVWRLQNKELMHNLQEQETIVATERLQENLRSWAQTQEFANLTAELLAG